MSLLDAINVATNRFFKLSFHRFPIDRSQWKDIRFTGFKPAQDSNIVYGNIYGQLLDNSFVYVTVSLSFVELEICRTNATYTHNLLDSRILTAMEQLRSCEPDPFDSWVKKVRKEHAEACSQDIEQSNI